MSGHCYLSWHSFIHTVVVRLFVTVCVPLVTENSWCTPSLQIYTSERGLLRHCSSSVAAISCSHGARSKPWDHPSTLSHLSKTLGFLQIWCSPWQRYCDWLQKCVRVVSVICVWCQCESAHRWITETSMVLDTGLSHYLTLDTIFGVEQQPARCSCEGLCAYLSALVLSECVHCKRQGWCSYYWVLILKSK